MDYEMSLWGLGGYTEMIRSGVTNWYGWVGY
jgi:hypothetical protein